MNTFHGAKLFYVQHVFRLHGSWLKADKGKGIL